MSEEEMRKDLIKAGWDEGYIDGYIAGWAASEKNVANHQNKPVEIANGME